MVRSTARAIAFAPEHPKETTEASGRRTQAAAQALPQELYEK